MLPNRRLRNASPSVAKLAVRAPNWVGDLVMATPILEAALRTPRWSEVKILVRKHLAGVLGDGPLEPNLVPVANSAAEVAAYRELAPDGVLLLSNSFGAAWRAFRGGAKIRAGSALGGRRPLLTHAVVPPRSAGRRVPIPTAHLLRDVAGLLEIAPADLHPRLYVSEERRVAAAVQLRGLGLSTGDPGYVICCPGAAFGAAKLWPAQHFAEVLDRLFEERGMRALVTGAPSESPLIDEVVRLAKSEPVALPEDARSLGGLRALVKAARLMVVGDSGPRWYSAAFDVPCVSVMGPNFPELTATSLERCEVVRLEGLECAPCLEKRCPLEHHRCMNELAPERVLEASARVLEKA